VATRSLGCPELLGTPWWEKNFFPGPRPDGKTPPGKTTPLPPLLVPNQTNQTGRPPEGQPPGEINQGP